MVDVGDTVGAAGAVAGRGAALAVFVFAAGALGGAAFTVGTFAGAALGAFAAAAFALSAPAWAGAELIEALAAAVAALAAALIDRTVDTFDGGFTLIARTELVDPVEIGAFAAAGCATGITGGTAAGVAETTGGAAGGGADTTGGSISNASKSASEGAAAAGFTVGI
jgi:hypothetical protein